MVEEFPPQHRLIRKAELSANALGYCTRPTTDTKRISVWRLSPIGWVPDALFSTADDAEDYMISKLSQEDR